MMVDCGGRGVTMCRMVTVMARGCGCLRGVVVGRLRGTIIELLGKRGLFMKPFRIRGGAVACRNSTVDGSRFTFSVTGRGFMMVVVVVVLPVLKRVCSVAVVVVTVSGGSFRTFRRSFVRTRALCRRCMFRDIRSVSKGRVSGGGGCFPYNCSAYFTYKDTLPR